MTSHSETQGEMFISGKRLNTLLALETDLIESLSSSGASLNGISIKLNIDDVILTLRCFVDDLPQVSFVKADTMASAFAKAVSMARSDRLKWHPDRYPAYKD